MIRLRPALPRQSVLGLLATVVLVLTLLAVPATAQARQTEDAGGLSLSDAIILGVVEGVTEYLPVSSTGHLLVTERALNLTDTPAEKDAADAYAIVIQFGAILAVLVLYWRRFWAMLRGLAGRDREGRRLAFALIAAFVPAAVIGFLGEKLIKDYLFDVWPIIAAWIVGGVVILGVVAYDRRKGITPQDGADLEHLTPGRALIVGALQCVAMWPGTSRSLVTILGGRLVGLSTVAAVEFSFLLGLVTLTAASGYQVVTDGGMIVDSLGVAMPIVGVVAAFVSAALAVKWMVGYLSRHSMAIFGWYRIVLGIAVGALVLTNVL